MTEYWIVTKIVTKCPRCGRKYTDEGEDAGNIFHGELTCETCGFVGEVGDY